MACMQPRSPAQPIGYNTDLVKPEEAPKSFADLLDPKWKGKIVKAHPDYSGTILTATFQLARDLGWSYFEQLARQNGHAGAVGASIRQRSSRSARARCKPTVSLSDLLLLKERGAPVEAVYATEGTPVITAPSGVFRSAPNPNAARLFQSFLFSVEAQQALVNASGLCAHSMRM